jgi:TRAP-type C4-dicarboxylate transport system permease small subunit
MGFLMKAADRIDRALQAVVSVIVFAMMALIVADATGRTFGWPIRGVVEITEEYLMVAIVFLALGFTHTAGRHIRVELFGMLWPVVGHRYVRLATNLAGAAYFALIAWQGAQQTAYAWGAGQRSASELAYPMAPAYALVVVGGAMMCLWLLLDAALVASGREAREKAEGEAA